MSESNMQNLLRNNRTKNLVKLFQEMMNRYGDHLKLFGGSSIIMNLAEQFPSPIELSNKGFRLLSLPRLTN